MLKVHFGSEGFGVYFLHILLVQLVITFFTRPGVLQYL